MLQIQNSKQEKMKHGDKKVSRWLNETVALGEKVMGHSSCAICCMVRDCRKPFERNLKFINRLRACFAESYLIIIENDSIDGTKELVKSLEGDDQNVFVDSFDTGSITLPKKVASGVNPSFSRHRVQKMADYRNRYLKLLNEKIGIDNVDWVLMLDPDVHEISLDGIKHSFGTEDKWDIVHANGRMKYGFFTDAYYDAYAFAEWGDETVLTEKKIVLNRAKLKSVSIGMPLLPVRSGFNALAIYRSKALKGTMYTCESNDDERVEVLCEHISFHDAIRRTGYTRQFLNPNMIIHYNTRCWSLFVWFKGTLSRLLRK